MPAISWVLYKERVVARNSPKYIDVDNRPLRQIVELHGHIADDQDFPGLHYFPLGVFTDELSPRITSGITINGDITFSGGAFNFTATDAFNIELAGHVLTINGGDVHLNAGKFFGDLDTVVIKTSLTVDAIATVNFNGFTNIAHLTLGADVTGNPLFPYSVHTINGVGFVALDRTVAGSEKVDHLSGPGGWRIRSSNGSNNLMEIIGTTLHMYFTGGIDFSGVAETGWSLGSGGTQKGGLVAGTDTLTTTQQVVNAIVALLFTKFKLAQA